MLASRHLQAIFTILSHDDFEPLQLEVVLDDGDNRRTVLHDEHALTLLSSLDWFRCRRPP